MEEGIMIKMILNLLTLLNMILWLSGAIDLLVLLLGSTKMLISNNSKNSITRIGMF